MSLTSILSAEAIENAIKDCQGLSTFANTHIFNVVFIWRRHVKLNKNLKLKKVLLIMSALVEMRDLNGSKA